MTHLHWFQQDDDWLCRLSHTHTLTLHGLGLYLSPVTPDDALFTDHGDGWFEIGLDFSRDPTDRGIHLDAEAFLLGDLASGQSVRLALGERGNPPLLHDEWTVPPFPPALLGEA
ncbi:MULTISPECIES: hypothetical protein [Deinococcus]|uniref:Uncharacterized protein n=1 Tax=Deinococcus rufus TaxID=2136097 RepID=A0ABV7Z1P2_9DEIO|nr:hypothetical protein [Deinococcus sp. AB2017081]WQE95263.1 hypothetical protein U2P90_18060 [Deinococcus sp. AB2017081]